MKLYVSEKSKKVFAVGTFKGRKVKVAAVCSPEDDFDIDYGKKIAIEKYKIREQEVKKNIHESNIRSIKRLINWCHKVLKEEEGIVESLAVKISNMNDSFNKEIHKNIK